MEYIVACIHTITWNTASHRMYHHHIDSIIHMATQVPGRFIRRGGNERHVFRRRAGHEGRREGRHKESYGAGRRRQGLTQDEPAKRRGGLSPCMRRDRDGGGGEGVFMIARV